MGFCASVAMVKLECSLEIHEENKSLFFPPAPVTQMHRHLGMSSVPGQESCPGSHHWTGRVCAILTWGGRSVRSRLQALGCDRRALFLVNEAEMTSGEPGPWELGQIMELQPQHFCDLSSKRNDQNGLFAQVQMGFFQKAF